MQIQTKNPWFLFAPFLVFYLILIYLLRGNGLIGDEPRYIQYAHNLLQGFYSPKNEVDLWNGPGYPLFLAPFIKIGFSTLGLKLLNGFLQYASIVYLYKTLLLWISHKKVMVLSLFWACYYIAFREMTYIYTESLANVLVCVLIYTMSKNIGLGNSSNHNNKNISNNNNISNHNKGIRGLFIPGIVLGILILTKVIFGYVVVALFFGIVVLNFFSKQNAYVQTMYITIIALCINLPYLMYTYQLTHKPLYWSNAGGMSLYWASTPVEGEYGDWNDAQFKAYCDYDTTMPCNAALFAKGHQQDYNQIYQFNGVARDSAFKQKAIANIKAHPIKYVKNTIANTGRLFFSIPTSYTVMRPQNLWRILPNAIVFCIFIFSLLLSAINIKKHPPFIVALLCLLFLYLGASIVVSAFQRQLYVVLPIILLWFGWLTQQLIQFRFRFKNGVTQ
jgi:hypothetical protein